MTLSLNEVDGAVRKAALGVGWSYGLAKELGHAAAWLAGRGVDATGAVLAAFNAPTRAAQVERVPSGWRFVGQPVIAAAPSCFDLLETAPDRETTFVNTDAPLLLLGYAGVAASANRAEYRLSFGTRVIEVSARGLTGLTEPLAPSDEITVHRADGQSVRDMRKPPSAAVRIDTEQTTWAQLMAFAAKSYVPSSTVSRALGAGAGLTDND
ncbi:MAG: DUF3726 domain-containing protein [Pseudomonadota bacterium]